MNHTQKTFLYIGIAIVLVGLAALLFFMSGGTQPSGQPASSPIDAAPAKEQGLGAELYEQSSNPIEDKVPALTPTTNPIEGAYTNPFE